MTTRYRLPNVLGGGEIEAEEVWGGCAGGRPEYHLAGGFTLLAPEGEPLNRVAPPELNTAAAVRRGYDAGTAMADALAEAAAVVAGYIAAIEHRAAAARRARERS